MSDYNHGYDGKIFQESCKSCQGTGMGAIRVEKSKCPYCKGHGYHNIAEEDHECDFSGDVDNDICPTCKEHTGFCAECGATECCG